MGTAVLRGVSAGLLVTVLTLMGGMIWTAMGMGGVSATTIVDIGLFLSCVVGGYRTGRESQTWVLGGVTGALYVGVGALLLALFLPLRAAGVLQVILEGTVLGLIAGAIGAGGRVGRGFTRPPGISRRSGYHAYAGEDRMEWHSPETEEHSPEDWESTFQEEPMHDHRPSRMQRRNSELPDWDELSSHVHKEDDAEQEFRGEREKVGIQRGEEEFLNREERKVVGYERRSPWWEEDIGKG